MNQKELDAIKERCDKATPGPWYTWADWMVHTESDAQSNGVPPNKVIGTFNNKNAEFIARARQDIPALLAEVERLQQAQRWIPVSERLPKKQQSVIVRLSSGGTQIGWILWNEWAWDGYKCTGAVVTHWMPLPEPPKEG